jgi:hypothetical protein
VVKRPLIQSRQMGCPDRAEHSNRLPPNAGDLRARLARGPPVGLRADSALCVNCNRLITDCSLHSVIVTCRRIVKESPVGLGSRNPRQGPKTGPEPVSRGRRLGTGSPGCQDKPVSQGG